ncbi:MAG: hypothetical protein LC624_03080 [Halobacteriales archaeon]|nr:hypothetical protein [Halobacteriales archaeon]
MTAKNPRTPNRMRTTLPWLLALGLCATAILPIAGALGLGAQGGGTADALWGAYSTAQAPGIDAAQDLDGAVRADAHADAKVDAQPALDAGQQAAMDAKAKAEAQAEAALREVQDTKESVDVGIHAKTDVRSDAGAEGALDSSADTGLYGGYDGKVDLGTSKHVDAQPVADAADAVQVEAQAQADASADMLTGMLAELQAQLDGGVHAAMDLAGQAQAAIGGALGFVQQTHVDVDASLDASTDVLGQVQAPDVALPQLGGAASLTAEATAAAQGIVR